MAYRRRFSRRRRRYGTRRTSAFRQGRRRYRRYSSSRGGIRL